MGLAFPLVSAAMHRLVRVGRAQARSKTLNETRSQEERMKVNRWTIGLAAAGLVSLPSVTQAEEKASPVMSALSSTTISGYVSASVWWVPGTGNANLPTFSYGGTAKADGFNLDVVKLAIERPLDEGQWSAGYKTEVLFGPDANALATTSSGLATSDFAIKQAYVALRAPVGNGLDIKLGVWDTLIGYEVFESANNPNFSRSYGYFIEPTHHTGLLLSYHVTDWLSVSGGVANGWTGAINDRIDDGTGEGEERKAFLGSLTITLPEDAGMFAGSSIYAGIVYGDIANGLSGGGGFNVNQEVMSYYLGSTLTTGLEGLSVGVALDYRDNGLNAVNPDNYAWTAALYASFSATEKLKLNGRAEYAKGSDGTWYTGGDNNELG